MEMNLGRHGATRGSWKPIAIRVVIKEIQDHNSRATKNKLLQLLIERMKEDDDALVAAAEYALDNALDAQISYAHRMPRTSLTPLEREQRREEDAKAIKEMMAKILYLNMEMPNGKRLRFCECGYVAKVCAPLARLAKKQSSTKLFGSAYNEDDIRNAIGE